MTSKSRLSIRRVAVALGAVTAGAISFGGLSTAHAAEPLPDGADVCFYTDANYSGESYCVAFPSADPLNPSLLALPTIPAEFNDVISSLQVRPDIDVSMWMDAEAGGDGITVSRNIEDFSAGWFYQGRFNDQVSSMFMIDER